MGQPRKRMYIATLSIILIAILLIYLINSGAITNNQNNEAQFPTQGDIDAWLDEMREENRGAGTTSVNVSSKTVKIFIMFGQSNMVGQGNYTGYPSEMRQESEYRLRLEEEGWMMQVPFNEFLRPNWPRGGHNGPEISFLYNLSQAFPGERFGVIKVAKGGTGIRAFSPDWTFDEANITGDGTKGPLYQLIREKIVLAQQTCDAEFVGVIMKQGGKDTVLAESSEGYIEEVKKVINEIRADTGVPDLPFFVGTYLSKEDIRKWEIALERLEVDDSDVNARKWINRNINVKIQARPYAFEVYEQLAYADVEIENTYVIVHGWLPTSHDGVHFNTRSQIDYGNMNAQLFIDMESQ